MTNRHKIRDYVAPILAWPYLAIIPLILLSATLGWIADRLPKETP